MFGLEKKPDPNDLYELEREWKNPAKASEWKKRLSESVETIKGMIRQGASPDQFHQLEHLLQGYLALQKIMNRITKQG